MNSVICIPLLSLFNCDFCVTTPRAATNKDFDVDLRGELEFSFVSYYVLHWFNSQVGRSAAKYLVFVPGTRSSVGHKTLINQHIANLFPQLNKNLITKLALEET